MDENAFFEVKNNKFWILEQRANTEASKKGAYQGSAWIFNNEADAIRKLGDLFQRENLDMDNLDIIGERYNLQEVEIASDKYNMKPISWLKVAAFLASRK